VDLTGLISINCLHDLLHYSYTGFSDFQRMSITQILELNEAAVKFEVERLHWLCENFLKSTVTLDNAHTILKGSHDFHQQSVKLFCMHFAVSHYTPFIAHKDGMKELGMDLFQEIVEFYQSSLTSPLLPLPIIPEPPSTVIADYKSIYENILPNLTGDGIFKIEKEFIHCHRAILAARSKQLLDLCSLPSASKFRDVPDHIKVPPIRGKIGKDGPEVVSAEAFRSMLKFIYYGETNINPVPACALLLYSRDCGLPELQKVCEGVIRDNINNNTALPTLVATYMIQMEDRESICKEFKKMAIDYILANLYEIELKSLKPLKKSYPKIIFDILAAEQRKQKGIPE